MKIFSPGVLAEGIISTGFLIVGGPFDVLMGFSEGETRTLSALPLPLLTLAAELNIRVALTLTSQIPPLNASNALRVAGAEAFTAGTYKVPR